MTRTLTIAICSYNRASQIASLVRALRELACPIPCEILVVNNNSSDNTLEVLARLASETGFPLRYVTESTQGIVHARNRAIEECLHSEYLLFMDDDELPFPTQLTATVDTLMNEGADCAGGKYILKFLAPVPRWLTEKLHPHLGKLDHGDQAFWIKDKNTPLWTGNIAFNMNIFRDDPTLRFDSRFNRIGEQMGGGEDITLFRRLLTEGKKIRYRPDMAIHHLIGENRLQKSYFLKIAWGSGYRAGKYMPDLENRTILRIPIYHYGNIMQNAWRCLIDTITCKPSAFEFFLALTRNIAICIGRWSAPNKEL